jgi:Holliday junction resolvasome RuvABC endonuclease subunit
LATQALRILGIDPGTRITGYGLIDQQGNRLIHVDNGAIMTRSASKNNRLTCDIKNSTSSQIETALHRTPGSAVRSLAKG